jgi:putative endonuclease
MSAQLLSQLPKKQKSPLKNPTQRQLLGKKGEDFAFSYLIQKGYRIFDRNFKGRPGELDIVAFCDNTLVFVEVKTRIGREFGLPEEAVHPRKLQEIIHTAEYYCLLHPKYPKALRIDVIAIEYDGLGHVVALRHIVNVTG